ncbi:hypothetical protein [Candidatus Uabimicrobium sp. HlEnr_7]|uniref:hypothetical protein n=1 Tax=Candidatus Uabimicrobium helgolandensis TaxID=3095367 RepID=UPI00355880C7
MITTIIIYYRKIVISSLVCILPIFILSCNQADRYVISESRVIEYRAPIDPISRFTNNFKGETAQPSYKRFFLSWLAEHKNLEINLGKSTLEAIDSHHNIQNNLSNMQIFLNEEDQQKLQAYKNLYDTLLVALRRKTSLRVLTTRYRILGRNIKKEFSPNTVLVEL